MWQASPRLTAAAASALGPLVGRLQPGKEQTWPARAARSRLVLAENSSRLDFLAMFEDTTTSADQRPDGDPVKRQ